MDNDQSGAFGVPLDAHVDLSEEFLCDLKRFTTAQLTIQPDRRAGSFYCFDISREAHRRVIVRYAPGAWRHIPHFAACAAIGASRLWEASPPDVYVAQPLAIPSDPRSYLIHDPGQWEVLAAMLAITVPAQTRFEEELTIELPAHRTQQRNYLRSLTHSLDPLLAPVPFEGVSMGLANAIRGYAALAIAAADRLGGANVCPNYRRHIDRQTLDPLLPRTAGTIGDHDGDRAYTDQCAEHFGTSALYRWVPLSEASRRSESAHDRLLS